MTNKAYYPGLIVRYFMIFLDKKETLVFLTKVIVDFINPTSTLESVKWSTILLNLIHTDRMQVSTIQSFNRNRNKTGPMIALELGAL